MQQLALHPDPASLGDFLNWSPAWVPVQVARAPVVTIESRW